MPMTGFYLETCKPEILKNEEFKLGLEMPHFGEELKRHGIDGAREFYNSIKTDNMPKFERFTERLREPEIPEESSGMHFGTQQKPDIMYLWGSLTEGERRNPFWKGYTWHLVVDYFVCQNLEDGNRMNNLPDKNLSGGKIRLETNIEDTVKYLKRFDPLNGDPEEIIQELCKKS